MNRGGHTNNHIYLFHCRSFEVQASKMLHIIIQHFVNTLWQWSDGWKTKTFRYDILYKAARWTIALQKDVFYDIWYRQTMQPLYICTISSQTRKLQKISVCELEINYTPEVSVYTGSIERKYTLKIVYFYKIDKIKDTLSVFCVINIK